MAAQTQTKAPPRQQQSAPPAQNAVVPFNARLPYPLELEKEFGVTEQQWRVLIDAIYPNAKTVEAVRMVVAYCKARNLDVFKRPCHIVPMYSSALRRQVETFWPGISEIRTTASRTKIYAGCDETVFGEEITKEFEGTQEVWEHGQKVGDKRVTFTVTFPSWARITVYKIVQGVRCAFPGPRVMWEETFAEMGKTGVPNEMWRKRALGQLEKCAEAAALRKAFPEEIGNDYAAEEMEGREIADGIWHAVPAEAPPRPTPPSPEKPGAAPAPAVSDAEYEEVDGPRSAETDRPPAWIEPPLNERGGIAWAEWIAAFELALADVKTPDEAKAVFCDNQETLDELKRKGDAGRSAYDKLKDAAMKRDAELSKAPAAEDADDPLPGTAEGQAAAPAASAIPGAVPKTGDTPDLAAFNDKPAGHKACADAMVKVFSDAATEEQLDELLIVPARMDRMEWLRAKAPTMLARVEKAINDHRALLRG